MNCDCPNCEGAGEVVVSITGEVRPPKLGEAANENCPICNGSGAAPGGHDDLVALDGVVEHG